MKRVYYEARGHETSGWPVGGREFSRLSDARAYLKQRDADPETSTITKVTVEDVPMKRKAKR